jgi:hypothetical protein
MPSDFKISTQPSDLQQAQDARDQAISDAHGALKEDDFEGAAKSYEAAVDAHSAAKNIEKAEQDAVLSEAKAMREDLDREVQSQSSPAALEKKFGPALPTPASVREARKRSMQGPLDGSDEAPLGEVDAAELDE